MPSCDMCGKEGPLTPTLVEGVVLKCCTACTTFGKIQTTSNATFARNAALAKPKREVVVDDSFVVANAGALVKAERERRGLRQVDLSRMLNVRESVVHQMESGHSAVSLDIVKKFEKGLGLTLVVRAKSSELSESQVEEKPSQNTSGSSSFTIGDLLKRK